jgi:hypothetical protein
VFSGIAMFDLSSWGGQADDAAVKAVAAQIRRAKQVRATRVGMERGMGERPGAVAAQADAYVDTGFAAQLDHTAVAWAPPAPLAAIDHYGDAAPAHPPIYPQPNRYDDRPRFGAHFDAAPVDHRPPAHTPPRRFTGLTPADDQAIAPPPAAPAHPPANPREWADAWVAAELRSRDVTPPNTDCYDHRRRPDVNDAAYRDLGGYGAGYPATLPAPSPPSVALPAGNSFDPLDGKSRALRSEPWTREDTLGYERPAGAQDPFGAPAAAHANMPPSPRRRSDSLFAALLIAGLAAGALGAVIIGSADRVTLASAPIDGAIIDDSLAASGVIPMVDGHQSAADAPDAAAPVRRVSLNDALGDSALAYREPARGGASAGADRGVDRRRPPRR